MQASVDGGKWQSISANQPIALQPGQECFFRAPPGRVNMNFNNHATNAINYSYGIDPFERFSGHVFTATGKFDLAGNVASLMRGNAECSSMAQVFPDILNWSYG